MSNRRKLSRVATFRLAPTREQYALLRYQDSIATTRMNRYSIALYAQRQGWIPGENSEKDSVTKESRLELDGLSSAVYVGGERRVNSDWQRMGKALRSARARVPSYKLGAMPIDSGARPNCGISIVRAGHEYAARLTILSMQSRRPEWHAYADLEGTTIDVPLHRGTKKDALGVETAEAFASGTLGEAGGMVITGRDDGKVLLRISYTHEIELPEVGDRVATLGPVTDDGRLWLRAEHHQQEYTGRLVTLRNRKEHWDGIRRRLGREVGRGKGRRRMKRAHFAAGTISFGDWCSTHLHTWSRDVITWCQAQGVGVLVVLDLAGGDWPAHQLEQNLKYKCEDAGIEYRDVKKAALTDASTERAAKAEARRKQRKAKQIGDAVRNLTHAIGGD